MGGRSAAPSTDFELLAVRLKYRWQSSGDPNGINVRGLSIADHRDRERIKAFAHDLFVWALELRPPGRPPDNSSILLFHLVNSLTVWKRKRDQYGVLNIPTLFDKHGRHKVERRWDDVARCLIWIHSHWLPIPWLGAFIKSHARRGAAGAMIELKKAIQRRYAHLAHRAPIGRRGDPEAAFYPLGIRRVVAEGDRFRAWEL